MRRGFTLVEMLISLSLMALITGVIIFSFGQSWKGWKTIAAKADKQQIEGIIGQRLASDIRSADEILAASSSQEIFIRSGTEITSYKLEASKVRRKKGVSTAYLTESGEINRLSFTYNATHQVSVFMDNDQFTVFRRN
ncbi:MAG: type II secretion system protein [Candidatus Margulisbacteria bacterium]|nr:type II secretion system protein [Candidatus Margulisiibacteriota bacterium]